MKRIQYIGTYEGQVDGHQNWHPGEVREVEDGMADILARSPAFWVFAPEPATEPEPATKTARTRTTTPATEE